MSGSRLSFLTIVMLCHISIISCSGPAQSPDSMGEDGFLDTIEAPETVTAELELISGNFQVGFLKQDLEPLVVRVVDPEGKGIPGIEVEFRLDSQAGVYKGEASLAGDLVTTDKAGEAFAKLSLGEVDGQILVRAFARGTTAPPVAFHLFSYQPDTGSRKNLCVLQINDFHMRMLPRDLGELQVGGLARIATMFKEIRRAHEERGIPVLIVNLGDDFENTLFHNLENSVARLYQLYDAMGVDLTQVGNHDYHFGVEVLDQQVGLALPNFRGELQGHPMYFTWGNVNPHTLFEPYQQYVDRFETEFSDPEPMRPFNQTLVLNLGDLKVGVLGVTTDSAIYTQVAGNPAFYKMVGAPSDMSQGMEFLNPDPRKSDYVNQGLDSLDSEGADLLIVASHAGLGFGDRVNIPPGKDQLIAEFARGPQSGRSVDVILSGHSHVALNHPIPVENPAGGTTWLVQAMEAGEFVGCLSLAVDVDAGETVLTDYHLLQVDGFIPEDPATKAVIDEMIEEIEKVHGPVFTNELGRLGVDLSSQMRAPAGLGKIIAEAFSQALNKQGIPCDVGMAVPSMYRADLRRGPVTEDQVYDVIPLHNLDHTGLKDEPLVILEMSPGLHDFSTMGLDFTARTSITSLEYILELFHSLEMLEDIYEDAKNEFNLEVMQLSNFSYQLDSTAPLFHRVVPGSVKVGGEPLDPSRTYRLTMTHSLGSNLSYIMNFIAKTRNPETGVLEGPLNLIGLEGQPFLDVGVPAWEALRDYLADQLDSGEDRVPEVAMVTGEWFRTTEPDLMVNPMDIQLTPARAAAGDEVEITVNVRNLGDRAVKRCRVSLLWETTPWDLTDDDDGRLDLEGMAPGFLGSLEPIGSVEIPVGPWPGTSPAAFKWTVPQGLPDYGYPIVVRLESLDSGEKDREIILGNNQGPDQAAILEIRAH